VVTNDDLATKYGLESDSDWIKQRTGIEERRFAEEGVACSDLALRAATSAIESAGLHKRDLGMIIFATLSPDCHFPGAGVYLQAKLGLCEGVDATFVPALDVRNQCSGFLYGMATAASMVQSGSVDNVLVVGAEVHSAALDLTRRGREVASLFGDGAGAAIVSATQSERGIRGWKLGADGRFADELCLKIWDISKRPYIPVRDGIGAVSPDLMYPHMVGKTVFKNAIDRMVAILTNTLRSLDLKLEDIDLFLFHQANLRINEMVRALLELPEEKVLSNIQRYGNTTAATIPLLLAEASASGRLKRGMRVAMVAFGSGFTWGCMVLDF
jgi:3-oxoacyl-[acyl-carrier-protein] synthase-3